MHCIFCQGGSLEILAAHETPHDQTFCALLVLLRATCPPHRSTFLQSMAVVTQGDEEPKEERMGGHPGHPTNMVIANHPGPPSGGPFPGDSP